MGRLIGVYGGSFNPPHAGHVQAARELLRLLSPELLLVIPAYLAPHKPQPAGSPTPEQRLELTRLAFAPLERVQVSDLELARQGVSYTVDTLTALKAQYPEDELLLVMGTDMLLSFSTWRAPERIAALATLCVLHRQDESPALQSRLQQTAAQIEADYGGRVQFVPNDAIEVSSTELRRMLAFGVQDDRLPPAVAARIRALGLYQTGCDWKQLPFDRLAEVSLSLHDEARRAHVRGCCQTAQALALRWGEDVETARRAGILHDVTKALAPAAQLALCDYYGQQLRPFERAHPKLLHAKSGAAVARHVFGESEAVCRAIEWHTTGREAMCQMEKIIYLADYIEPTRDFDGVARLRALAFSDLDAALLEGLRMSIELLTQRGQPIDEQSMAAWQYLDERSKRHGSGTNEAANPL